MTAGGGFSVLFAKPQLPPLEAVAAVIARFTEGPLFDARVKAKNTWGFLGDRLTEGEAGRLSALAEEAGLETRVFASDALASMPPSLPVHWLRAAPEGLFYTTGSTTDEKPCPWDRVRLLAGAGLKEQISVTKMVHEGPSAGERAARMGITMVTGIPLGAGKGKDVKKVFQETELFMYLDVFIAPDGGPARLHVDAHHFNYAALGETRTTSTFGNFKLLLQSLDRFAGSAFRNKGAQGILAGQPINLAGYEGRGGYEKEILWLLSLLCP